MIVAMLVATIACVVATPARCLLRSVTIANNTITIASCEAAIPPRNSVSKPVTPARIATPSNAMPAPIAKWSLSGAAANSSVASLMANTTDVTAARNPAISEFFTRPERNSWDKSLIADELLLFDMLTRSGEIMYGLPNPPPHALRLSTIQGNPGPVMDRLRPLLGSYAAV